MIRSFDRRSGRWRFAAIAAAGAIALFFAQTLLATADDAKVSIDNFAFTPAELTVKPGTTVVFENHDDIPHLVVAVDGKYLSLIHI